MHKYIILFFLVVLFSCGEKGRIAPGDVIQADQMANLLVQIHLIDGSLYNGTQTPDSLYKFGMGRYLEVFKKFNTDSAQFRKSINYYTEQPDKLSAIYDKVDARIKTLSDSINNIQAKERIVVRKKDSLRTDSIKKAKPKPVSAVQQQQKLKQNRALKSDSIKKLKNIQKPNAVPIK